MNENQKREFIASTKFAIACLNPERTKVIRCAFFESELTEEDFIDLRSRLIQSGLPASIRLRMATPSELDQARKQYLQNQHNISAEYYENIANSDVKQ